MKLLNGRKGLLFLMFFTGFIYGYSQQSVIWSSLQLPVQLSPKWQLPADVSYRTIGFSSSAYQYTFRTGLRRIFNQKWQAAAGGAMFFTRTSFKKDDQHFGKEYRLWQEGLAEHPVAKKLFIQNRARVEERFFEATSAAVAFTAYRFRYRVALIKLIDKWRLLLANEYMQQQDRGKFHFQQNRVSGSVSLYLNSATYVQTGYIWSALKGPDQHILLLTFQKTIALHGASNNRK
jgi:hypothetical protein